MTSDRLSTTEQAWLHDVGMRVRPTMTDEKYRRAVGMRIRVWRVLRDQTQDDLARAAGVTRNFVSAIERGAQGLDAVRLRRIAAAMGMPLAELLADPGDDAR